MSPGLLIFFITEIKFDLGSVLKWNSTHLLKWLKTTPSIVMISDIRIFKRFLSYERKLSKPIPDAPIFTIATRVRFNQKYVIWSHISVTSILVAFEHVQMTRPENGAKPFLHDNYLSWSRETQFDSHLYTYLIFLLTNSMNIQQYFFWINSSMPTEVMHITFFLSVSLGNDWVIVQILIKAYNMLHCNPTNF